LDGLDPAERGEFERHLAGCYVCHALVDGHALVAAQLGSLAGDDAAGAPSWAAIRAGVVGSAPRANPGGVVALRHRRRTAWLAAAAAVAAIAAGVTTWQVGRGGGGPQPLASVAACQRAEGCHVVALKAAAGTPATVLVDGDRFTLIPTSMPAPPAGHVWALWQVPQAGPPVLLSEFVHGVSPARLKAPYDVTASFAVSRERTGTAPTAPSDVVATGRIA
jgi:anti-sigma-K factor RskA